MTHIAFRRLRPSLSGSALPRQPAPHHSRRLLPMPSRAPLKSQTSLSTAVPASHVGPSAAPIRSPDASAVDHTASCV